MEAATTDPPGERHVTDEPSMSNVTYTIRARRARRAVGAEPRVRDETAVPRADGAAEPPAGEAPAAGWAHSGWAHSGWARRWLPATAAVARALSVRRFPAGVWYLAVLAVVVLVPVTVLAWDVYRTCVIGIALGPQWATTQVRDGFRGPAAAC
jgi:hypothetical protein